MDMNLGKAGKIGLLFFGFGAFLFILGFSIPNWVTLSTDDSEYQAGLWRYCEGSLCRRVFNPAFKFFGKTLPAWFRGTQALACLALITLIGDGIVRGLFVFCDGPKAFLLASIALDVATAVLAFFAAGVFEAHMEDTKSTEMSLSWSFALDIIAGILMICAAACFFAESKLNSSPHGYETDF